MCGFDDVTGFVELLAQVSLDLRLPSEFFEQNLVFATQPQPALVVAFELHPAVTGNGLCNVRRDVRGKRELGVLVKYRDHLLGGDPSRGRIPERQVRDAIGVDMLGALLQFRERGNLVAGLGIFRVKCFKENRPIGLYKQRVGRIVRRGGSAARWWHRLGW